jgi:hypothetical protein
MGLTISAYSEVNLIEAYSLTERKESPADHQYDLEPGYVYLYAPIGRKPMSVPVDGYYQRKGKLVHISAGSYSGYNAWRELLCDLVGTTTFKVWYEGFVPPAFHELLNYSDCEGAFRTETCVKLAKDFEAWEKRAEEYARKHGLPSFFTLYRQIQQAFDIAATAKGGSGVVHLH